MVLILAITKYSDLSWLRSRSPLKLKDKKIHSFMDSNGVNGYELNMHHPFSNSYSFEVLKMRFQTGK